MFLLADGKTNEIWTSWIRPAIADAERRLDAIENYDKFPEPTESYRQLYAALKIMQESYTPLSEPRFEGYYGKVSQLYDGLRKMQQELPARAAAGESIDTLAEETWALLCAIH